MKALTILYKYEFINMKLPDFFGLDIGNHSIKVAKVKYKSKSSAELTNIGQVEIEKSLIESSDTKDLVKAVKEVREIAKITTKKVVAAIPESAVFSRLIVQPDVEESKMEQSIHFEAKQYLPVPLEDVQIDWIPVTKKDKDGNKTIQILLVAAPKKVVKLYMDFAEAAGLDLIALETETIATARSLTYNNTFDDGMLMVDFGGTGTDISVVKGQKVIFSQSIGTGSDVLTKAIAADFNLDQQQAEQYKRTYGLLKDQADGKIYSSLSPVMKIITNEINKTLNYFKEHLKESTPKKIIVVGDGANLPGISEFLTANLGIDTEVKDPVAALDMNAGIKSEVAQFSTSGFTVSVGLALKKE